MPSMNDPAGRLLKILRAVQKSRKESNPRADEAFSEVLKVPKDNMPLLLRRLGRLLELPDEVRACVSRQQDVSHKVYLKWLPKVQKGFSKINLTAQVSTFIDPIDDTALYGLEVCSDLLSRRLHEPVFDDSELDRLYAETGELIADVLKSNIDPDLQEFMLDKLDIVRRALEEREMSEGTPLCRAVEITFGAVVMHQSLAERSRATPLGKRFWAILANIAVLVTLADGTMKITEGAKKLLPEVTEVTVESQSQCDVVPEGETGGGEDKEEPTN